MGVVNAPMRGVLQLSPIFRPLGRGAPILSIAMSFLVVVAVDCRNGMDDAWEFLVA